MTAPTTGPARAAGTRPQPYYEDECVTLWNVDALSLLRSLPDASVDLVLTDPPYNAINRETSGLRLFDKGDADALPVDVPVIAAEFVRVVRGSIYVWCSDEQYTDWTLAFKHAGLTTRKCAWWKSDPSPMNGERLWLSALELCVFARKGGATFNLHCQPPVWKGPVARDVDHPTPKPEWLMRRLIQASTKPGDVVLDSYAGSGTTLRAAKDLERRALASEINPAHCGTAVSRLAQSVLPLGGIA